MVYGLKEMGASARVIVSNQDSMIYEIDDKFLFATLKKNLQNPKLEWNDNNKGDTVVGWDRK